MVSQLVRLWNKFLFKWLLCRNCNIINKNHFIPQKDEEFDKDKIYKSKSLKVFNLEEIDYDYIEKLFNIKIPIKLINFKGNHIRKTYDDLFNSNVSFLDMNKYLNKNVPLENFYNEDIKSKIYEFYKNDFLFFKKNGIDYTNTLILNKEIIKRKLFKSNH